MKPIIGIIGNRRSDFNELRRLPITYVPDGFVRGVQHAGGLPVVIPVSKPELAAAYLERVDGLLLAGGQDVSPIHYGEEPQLKVKESYPERDLFELTAIKLALSRYMPIFAVCRGMQILNVAKGGTLYQDISQYDRLTVQHDQTTDPIYPTHHIKVIEDSELRHIIGRDVLVNSVHHQAIKELSAEFKPTAYSPDHLIEAFESADQTQSVVAVQWHPELLLNDYTPMQGLFDNFIERVSHYIDLNTPS